MVVPCAVLTRAVSASCDAGCGKRDALRVLRRGAVREAHMRGERWQAVREHIAEHVCTLAAVLGREVSPTPRGARCGSVRGEGDDVMRCSLREEGEGGELAWMWKGSGKELGAGCCGAEGALGREQW